jgi:tetratricopeptide (TPR) repeat protein
VIKIRQKDFYGAMFTFERIGNKKWFSKEQMALYHYAEAVLNLMKRKYKVGIGVLTSLIRSRTSSIREYLGCCYAYRGFGYAALENHAKAVRDFNSAAKHDKPDKATLYNKCVSEGILAAAKENFKKAGALFAQAREIFDRNVEPLFYIALLAVQQARTTDEKRIAMTEARQLLDTAIKLKDGEAELYYFRGLIHYYLENPVDAIPDLDAAIDKAEDNLAKHFIARGCCYAVLKLYKEAL